MGYKVQEKLFSRIVQNVVSENAYEGHIKGHISNNTYFVHGTMELFLCSNSF